MSTETTVFSIRMDAGVKSSLDDFCAAVGMNTNTAINMFARVVVREKRLPFEVAVASDSSYEAFYNSPETIAAREEAKRLMKNPNAKKFKTMESLIADLESNEDD